MEYLLYVLLFALAAALLYIWGLRRSRDQQKTMEAMLAGKCEKRIRKHLRQNGSVTGRGSSPSGRRRVRALVLQQKAADSDGARCVCGCSSETDGKNGTAYACTGWKRLCDQKIAAPSFDGNPAKNS